MIEAIVVADSISVEGNRITTLQLKYPRFLLSQINTHRAFSRSSASSRAIPVRKMIAEATGPDCVVPLRLQKNKPGMQSSEDLSTEDTERALFWWRRSASKAAESAEELIKLGVHKQIANRILEPFIHARTVVTATDWDNFFKLRCHDAAQPEMSMLANAMRDALNASSPVTLAKGEWHLPYACEDGSLQEPIKTSVAGSARVSYLNHDNSARDKNKDIELHDRLEADGHWSPFEHAATPANGRFDNFNGWKSCRYLKRI